ncbi:hypothetical protein ACH4YO_42590, partial [Streptomyces noursei]|uniref:hypothetical protein n=1 Tax=Streptomyces noursei TaxID=1971 RepID=UPI0033FFDB68
PPDLDHQGQSQTKITKWVTFDPPSEGHRSAVFETSSVRSSAQRRRTYHGGLTNVLCKVADSANVA